VCSSDLGCPGMAKLMESKGNDQRNYPRDDRGEIEAKHEAIITWRGIIWMCSTICDWMTSSVCENPIRAEGLSGKWYGWGPILGWNAAAAGTECCYPGENWGAGLRPW
jgi:hypothetical protein